MVISIPRLGNNHGDPSVYCAIGRTPHPYLSSAKRSSFLHLVLVIDAQAKAEAHGFSLDPVPLDSPLTISHHAAACVESLCSSMFSISPGSFFCPCLYCAVPSSFPSSIHFRNSALVYFLSAVPTHQLSYAIFIV